MTSVVSGVAFTLPNKVTGIPISTGNGAFGTVVIGSGLSLLGNTLSVTGTGGTSGTSILAGNGLGGFSNVTVGSGLTFSGGILSATGSSSNLLTANNTWTGINTFTISNSANFFITDNTTAADGSMSPAGVSGFNINKTLTLAGNSTAGSANQATLFVGATVNATASPASYEKMAGYFDIICNDPSTGTSILRDSVAVEAWAHVGNGNTQARMWAYHGGVTFDGSGNTGSVQDGICCVAEFELYNYGGSNQPNYNTPTSKYGVHVDCFGGYGTAGVSITSGDGTGAFYDGLSAINNGLVNNFLNLMSGSLSTLMAIDKNGNINFSSGRAITWGSSLINGSSAQINLFAGGNLGITVTSDATNPLYMKLGGTLRQVTLYNDGVRNYLIAL